MWDDIISFLFFLLFFIVFLCVEKYYLFVVCWRSSDEEILFFCNFYDFYVEVLWIIEYCEWLWCWFVKWFFVFLFWVVFLWCVFLCRIWFGFSFGIKLIWLWKWRLKSKDWWGLLLELFVIRKLFICRDMDL